MACNCKNETKKKDIGPVRQVRAITQPSEKVSEEKGKKPDEKEVLEPLPKIIKFI